MTLRLGIVYNHTWTTNNESGINTTTRGNCTMRCITRKRNEDASTQRRDVNWPSTNAYLSSGAPSLPSGNTLCVLYLTRRNTNGQSCLGSPWHNRCLPLPVTVLPSHLKYPYCRTLVMNCSGFMLTDLSGI